MGISYRLYKTNRIHQSISLKGESEALDYTKPKFLSTVCQDFQNQSLPREREFTHILYVDCDVVFIPNQEKFDYLQNLCDRNIDFGIYNWLGDQEACAGYVQTRNKIDQESEVWTTPMGNRLAIILNIYCVLVATSFTLDRPRLD